jgi:hypothetical protein
LKELKCKRCQNIWTYKGSNTYIANCSCCKSTVFIKKSSLKAGSSTLRNDHGEDHQRLKNTYNRIWKELPSDVFASTDIISNNQLKDKTQGQESPSPQDTILDKAGHDDAKDDVNIGADF